MLRYEREIDELLAELELREQCDRRALPPPPYGRHSALWRLFPPAPEVHFGVRLVGAFLLLAGVLLGGTFGPWAVLIGVALLIIAAARCRLVSPVTELPADVHLYRVPPHRY